MKTIDRLALPALLALCSLLAGSCQREGIGFGAKLHEQSSIKLTVAGVSDTKAGSVEDFGKRIDSLVIKGDDGEDLLVEAFVSDYTDLPFRSEATKGSVVNTTSINQANSKFIVNAWLGSANRYSGSAAQLTDGRVYEAADATDYHFIKGGAAVKSDSEWSLTNGSGNEYIWRNAVPTTFWSYYPETVSGKVTRSITLPGDTASDPDQKKIGFSYSIGNGAAATDLTDIIFAYNLETVTYQDANDASHGTLLSGNEAIDIHFYHALPAIRFDVSGLVRKGKVIKAITLEGMVSSGNCQTEGENGSPIDFSLSKWTLGSDKVTVRQEFTASGTGSDFTEESVDVNPATGSKDAGTLQSFANDKIFFPLPQTIEGSGIKVTIEYIHTGDDVVVTKSFVLNHTEPWKSGKYYTYRLSVTGVDLYVDDEVTGNEKSDLVIKNIGAEPAYIRAMIAGNWVNASGDILLEWDPEDTSVGTIVWGSGVSAWTKGADGFYYHKASVAPGAATSQLFESYTVTARPSILEDSDYLEFTITAQSVLADENKASAIAAWGATAASYLNN